MFDAFKLFLNEPVVFADLIGFLDKYGYVRCKKVSVEGDYSFIGEVILIYLAGFDYPVRADLSNGIVMSITSVSLGSFQNIDEHNGVIVPPLNILKRRKISKGVLSGNEPIDSFVDIEPGDHVVHVDYGIGKYIGMQKVHSKKGLKDFFVVQYKGTQKLYVPQEELDKLQKYIGFLRRPPVMNSLKSKRWLTAKKEASEGVYRVAKELLSIQAKRESTEGFAFKPDTDWQREMEGAFPFRETPDQSKAAVEVKKDMERPKPMDRLLCGDVGYGKTEVALRAAFKAVMDNRQAAILVPTTILAEQHINTFTKRLKSYPVNIQMLNRFKTPAEQARVVADLAAGKIDIIIGTHRLLSDDVKFKDLGLLIVDEEQRFGVHHKEKIKSMSYKVDILTLTATPIPRTLYMALMGGKDISIIQTPPLDRLPVHTEIIENDRSRIKEAILRELDRGGQVYYIHNRVETIEKAALSVAEVAPKARIMVGHGQMSSKMLEETMLRFIKGEVDVLVATTIIESGIDIPNANTMIIDHADKFGLADLYQLRGRIGRFDRQAYVYLIVRDMSILTHEVQERLVAMKKYEALGSGFKIAMRDLEMRGAGNILGTEQSGFINQIGFDLYCRLLKEEIDRLKGDSS